MIRDREKPFPPHFDGKRFFNPEGNRARGFVDVFRWKLTSRPERSPRWVYDVEPSMPPDRVTGQEVRITFINHSTVLIQCAGANILTDPIWSERTSPFASFGPRRRRAPGVRWDDLPPIDVTVLSHNHYDHLDLPTLRRLNRKPHGRFVTPAGVARLLRSQDIGPVDELDWGDAVRFEGATVHCVPAAHFSARGLHDRNRALWCGYVIEAGGRIIYFAGDTAFGSHFAQIRDRFGAPCVAFLPVGAYEPRWFMSAVHMSPDEAVEAHRILGAETSIAIHHGTFQLGDDAIDTPRRRLLSLEPGESFVVLNNGQSITIS